MMTNKESLQTRRYLLGLAARNLFLGFAAATAQGKGNGKGKGKRGGKGNKGFASSDATIIFEYVGANPGLIAVDARQLPPGLAKKLGRGKPLPPGWQKKMVMFPAPLEQRLPPLPIGCRRVIVDRWAMVIADGTNVVLDIIDLIRN
jgi:hypothetical protein